MPDLRQFTLWARDLLTGETAEQLQQVYRLDAETGARLPVPTGHLLEQSAEKTETRARIEKLLDDETDAGLTRAEGVQKLIRETAFTHLNRFVAFKLMESRGLIASPLARGHNANGFIKWAVSRPDQHELYERGDMPKDAFGEGPRDRAYRHFLLWQSGELAREIKVVFDPDNVPSALFPRPGVLKELISALNSEERKGDWLPGNEETIGWVYQFFNEPDLEQFHGQSAMQVPPELVGPRTQNYTPRWVVEFLVHNSLGRLWLSMHPDSDLGSKMKYLVPLPTAPSNEQMKPVRDISILDPATGTMHFGLVAFDLLTQMYAEESARAGTDGWPNYPSVEREADVPAAILANNLYGIDIDLRAIQLAALALYLRAKQLSKTTKLAGVNLACADVKLFRGQHLGKIADEMELPHTLTRELFRQFAESLEDAAQMGTLVRLEKHFERLSTEELRTAINEYVRRQSLLGQSEAYFAEESAKGLRLLEFVTRRYDIVVTNPPYLDSGDYNPSLKAFLSINYRDTSRNLYAAMMRRCIELLTANGRLGILTGQSFMFLSSFNKLRELYGNAGRIECMTHFGYGLFDARIDTTAFVLRSDQLEMERRKSRAVYFRLIREPDANAKRVSFEQALAHRATRRADSRTFEYIQGDFAQIPGGPWAYWASEATRRLFTSLPSLSTICKPWVGLQTSDNPRFLRYWWEVGISRICRGAKNEQEAKRSLKRWFPHMKGGEYKRWYGNQAFVVDWGDDGKVMKAYGVYLKSRVKSPPGNGPLRPFPYYFREGVTWTHTTAKGLNARYMPAGFICNVEGMACYPGTEDAHTALGLLNSSFASYLVNHLNATVHYGATEVGRIPWPSHIRSEHKQEISSLVKECIAMAVAEEERDDSTFDFIQPASWPNGLQAISEQAELGEKHENRLNALVFEAFGVSQEDRLIIAEELAMPSTAEIEAQASESEEKIQNAEPVVSMTQEILAKDWVSYAAGIALGRFVPGERDGLGRGTLCPQVNEVLLDLVTTNGLVVLQRDHPQDLAARVLAILSVIYGDAEAASIVRTAIGSNGDLRDALATYLQGSFFKAHVKRYRKRPVYWLLQSPKQKYSVFLFHEKATDQTLASLQGSTYLGGRIFQLNKQIEEARQREASLEGQLKAHWRNKAQELTEDLADLDAFDSAITATNNEQIMDTAGRQTTACWSPEWDDGVLLNAAPLYRLTPAWKKADAKLDLKKTWETLKAGEYPWAKTAMRYWPRETLAACKDNKSYRIAHGLE